MFGLKFQLELEFELEFEFELELNTLMELFTLDSIIIFSYPSESLSMNNKYVIVNGEFSPNAITWP
jgi:hypothetical protein